MAKEILVDNYKKDGERLIERLQKTEFKITTALWYYLSDAEEWRLILTSPYVKENGPLNSYRLINSTINKINRVSRKKLAFSSNDISVVDPNEPLINLLKGKPNRGMSIRHSKYITLDNVSVDGFFIEGAYIYFID